MSRINPPSCRECQRPRGPCRGCDRHTNLDLPTAPADADVIGVEMVDENGIEPRAFAADPPATLDAQELEEPTAEELEALSADMLGTDDSVRMYLKEIGGSTS